MIWDLKKKEKKIGKRQVRTRVDRVKKTTATLFTICATETDDS